VSGSGFTGATVVKFGTTNATNVHVISDAVLSATTPAALTPGAANVQVYRDATVAGNATKSNAFTYLDLAPTVVSLTPSVGLLQGGTVVTVRGTNLAFVTSVTVGGRSAALGNKTATSCTFVTPASSLTIVTSVTAVVTNGAGSAMIPFTYTSPATITLTIPSTVDIRGESVQLIGTALQQTTSVTVAGVGAVIQSKSATQLTLTAPPHAAAAGAGAATLALVGADNHTTTWSLQYVDKAPLIATISPSTGSRFGGTLVRIAGTNLQYVTQVVFGGVAATISSQTATTLQVVSPRQTTAGSVTVTLRSNIGGAPLATSHFTYI
jgi:hypothetical protein